MTLTATSGPPMEHQGEEHDEGGREESGSQPTHRGRLQDELHAL